MERLTKKIDNGRIVTMWAEARSYGETDPEDGFFYNYFTGEAVDKLAAYEDTGLEPEEILNLQSGVIPAHWGDLFRAECEGRFIVLPCKVGDIIYVIKDGKIFDCMVYHIIYSNYYGKVTATAWTKAGIGAAFEHFGKTVFLTRAEAEKAMGVSG